MIIKKTMLNAEGGFTLIEALIAMAILTVGLFALYGMQIVSIDGNATGNSISQASNIAAEQIEGLISRPINEMNFSVKLLEDVNGNGTKHDLDENGADDAGNNFGLDDVDAAADYSVTPANQQYSIFYNVAIDVPLKETRLVQVIVRDNANQMRNPIRFQYIKNENI